MIEIEPPGRENPTRVVWALAWPAVALNSLQVVNTLLDRFFIGHLESSALTAQGASQNVMFLMFSIAAAIGTAATAIVSRSYGAEDVAGYRIGAKEATSVSVIFGFLLAAASAGITPFAAHLILP
ncbi:MAG TPA: MATE family efflux transporter, partial [Fimbriimonadaceae bacterium]|nr:MATE family efflux transporter [Fimbriimonadaceae bacterium]